MRRTSAGSSRVRLTNTLTSPEIALLELGHQGDTRAFDDLIEPYRHELLVYCYRLLGSLHDAEDVVQETLLRAWKYVRTFQQLQSLRAWLYKIATNVCLTTLGRLNRRLSAAAPSPAQRLIEPTWLDPLPLAFLAH